jgi:[ribosomal protein S5]-alanine N-acetyltransferase
MEFEPIATERLVLRKLETRDRARLVQLANNWRVAKNLGTMPFPYTEAAADEWLGKQDELWAGGKSRPLAITLNGDLIGGCGVGTRPDRDDEEWELGYWLGEPYWNRGYASEAALALRDHAFEAVKLDQLIAGHYADNHASGRVLTKAGFRYITEAQRYSLARGTNVRCLEMVLTKARWQGVKAGVGREELVA